VDLNSTNWDFHQGTWKETRNFMRTWGASNPQAMDAEIDLAPSDFTGKRWGWNLDFSSDFSCGEVHFFYMIYPLVNIQKTMENHHF